MLKKIEKSYQAHKGMSYWLIHFNVRKQTEDPELESEAKDYWEQDDTNTFSTSKSNQ